MTTETAVLAEGLHKRYGEKRALDGFDLAVPYGTVYGLLGPNGAGKTTAVRILSTLLALDGGRAAVGGHDVVREARRVPRLIGLTGQYAAVDEILTGRQNLEMFGRLFHLGARRARARAVELLEQFDLVEAADKGAKEYSGGMRRRLDLAASMILRPRVLFLDEPTTGLDPPPSSQLRFAPFEQGVPPCRGEVWDSVRALVAQGTTVLLTTQYLEEADKLASRIAVIDAGRTIADDTPEALKNRVGGDRIEVVVAQASAIPDAMRAIAKVTDAEPAVDLAGARVHAPVRDRVAALTEVARTLQDEGVAVEDIGLRRPTLDDVFLQLTGSSAGDDVEVAA
ncbi:ATP-binding cassette domain-containing protein [Streptomyces sp. NPDC051940]|uniref:ATP-binding cassette domain-containing protein n=1 Tax=Streptomyces sp. NPDC051940 TaxID=3155675 RepID=UPI003429BA87